MSRTQSRPRCVPVFTLVGCANAAFVGDPASNAKQREIDADVHRLDLGLFSCWNACVRGRWASRRQGANGTSPRLTGIGTPQSPRL